MRAVKVDTRKRIQWAAIKVTTVPMMVLLDGEIFLPSDFVATPMMVCVVDEVGN